MIREEKFLSRFSPERLTKNVCGFKEWLLDARIRRKAKARPEPPWRPGERIVKRLESFQGKRSH